MYKDIGQGITNCEYKYTVPSGMAPRVFDQFFTFGFPLPGWYKYEEVQGKFTIAPLVQTNR